MTLLDWGIAVFIFFLALWGFKRGLIVGALGLAGLILGAVVGSRLAPVFLEGGSSSPYAPMIAACGALLFGSLALAVAAGAGQQIRDAIVRGHFGEVIDGIGGAILIAAVGLGLVWVFGAVALVYPGAGNLRKDVQKSFLLSGINEVMPPSGPLINALHRIDPVPDVVTSPGDINRPNSGVASLPAVRTAAGSVVKVVGSACGVGVMGSGWVVSHDVIVTNAHVVAGQDDTRIEAPNGQTVDATPIGFTARNDLAILAANVDLPPLPVLSSAPSGRSVAVVGYPLDGDLTLTPARTGETKDLIADDAYGQGPFKREMLALRGNVQHGNSGGPLVDARGRVLGTVFAATTEGPPGGLAIPNDVLRQILATTDGSEVDTGPCTE